MEILLSNYVFIRPISVRSGLHLLNIECVQPSADFFSLSKEEVLAEQRVKVEAMERETRLRTGVMQESERQGVKRKYKYCFNRFMFPCSCTRYCRAPTVCTRTSPGCLTLSRSVCWLPGRPFLSLISKSF